MKDHVVFPGRFLFAYRGLDSTRQHGNGLFSAVVRIALCYCCAVLRGEKMFANVQRFLSCSFGLFDIAWHHVVPVPIRLPKVDAVLARCSCNIPKGLNALWSK